MHNSVAHVVPTLAKQTKNRAPTAPPQSNMDPQQNVPAGSEVRVVSASVIAQLQAQGLQVRVHKIPHSKKATKFLFFYSPYCYHYACIATNRFPFGFELVIISVGSLSAQFYYITWFRLCTIIYVFVCLCLLTFCDSRLGFWEIHTNSV